MRKPLNDEERIPLDDTIIVVHHVMEALDEMAHETIEELGLEKYISEDASEKMERDNVTIEEAVSVGAAITLHKVHGIIHDLMSADPKISDIKDSETRRIAREHEPNFMSSDEVSDEDKDMLNKILRRK